MKIANKISLSFLAVSLLIAGTALPVFYKIAKDNLQKSIYNNLATAVASRARHIETYLDMLEISVGQLSKSTVLENLLKINGKGDSRQADAFAQAIKRLRRTKEVNPSIAEFMLLDATGKVVASSDESMLGLDKSTDAYFLGAQKGIYLKDVYFSETVKMLLMVVSAPFLDSQTGEFLGVIAARVRLTDLNNITTSEIGLGKTGEIYIVNKYGCMITPSRFKEDVVLKRKVDTLNVRQAWLHKAREPLLSQDVDVSPNYRGVQVLGVHEYLPRMEWAVLAEIDAKEAFSPLAKLRLLFLMILFIAPLIAWLLGVFIAGVITGPLHRLHKGTEIIGSGNLDYKVGTDVKDEVGQLSRAFDTMTGNLRTTTTSVENLNKEITERKRAEEETRQSYDIQTVINSLLGLSLENIALNDMLEKALDHILSIPWLSPGSKGAIFLVEDEPGVLVLKAQRLSTPLQTMCARVPFGKCLCGRAASSGEIVFADHVDERHEHRPEGMSPHGHYCVPILSAGKVLGVINTYVSEGHCCNQKEEKFLRTVADVVAGIIERKRAEEIIRRERDFSQASIDSLPGLFYMLDDQGRFLRSNKNFEKVSGYSADELSRMTPMDLFGETDKRSIADTIQRVFQAGEAKVEADFLSKDQTKTPYFFTGKLFQFDQKSCLIGMGLDITERKKAEKELLETNRRLQQENEQRTEAEKSLAKANDDLKFAVAQLSQSNKQLHEFDHLAAHDLKTPLRGIGMLAQWLLKDYYDKFDDYGREQVNLLVRRVRRMDDLVIAILQYSTIARNKQNEHQVDLNPLIKSVIADFQPTANITLTVNHNLPVLTCEEEQIRQVFYNLVANAVKFMDKPDGHITIDCEDEIYFWKFSVADNGPGIEPQHFERIFRLFQTLGDHEEAESVGIGLTIAKKIIELYGGKIWLTSQPGIGSTFYFTLPKREETSENETATARKQASIGL